MDINLFDTDPESNEILLKRYILDKAIEYDSDIKDVNFDGSNISTLIAALNYVYTGLSIRTDLIFNELSDNAENDQNLAAKMKLFNFDYRRMVSSKILIEIKQTDDSVTAGDTVEYDIGDVITIETDDYMFNYVFENKTIITDTQVKLIFTEGEMVSQQYYLSSNIHKIIIEGYKFDIEANSLLVYNNATSEYIPLLLNNDNDAIATNTYLNGEFYFIDYTDENNLMLVFSDGILGSNVSGQITVSFIKTNGDLCNNIQETEFSISSDDRLEFAASTNTTESDGGLDSIQSTVVRDIMHRSYQRQDRIVSIGDLNVELQYVLPNWQMSIIDASDLPINAVIPGRVYTSLYQVSSTGDINLMNYDNYADILSSIINKIKFGTVLVFNDILTTDIEITYNLILNQLIVFDKYTVINKINNILMSNINTLEYTYVNKQLFQMYVIQESIEGMIDFGIQTLIFKNEKITDFDDEMLFKNYKNTSTLESIMSDYTFHVSYDIEYIGAFFESLTLTNADFDQIEYLSAMIYILKVDFKTSTGVVILNAGTSIFLSHFDNNDITNDSYILTGIMAQDGESSSDNDYTYNVTSHKIQYSIEQDTYISKKYDPILLLKIKNIIDNTDLVIL